MKKLYELAPYCRKSLKMLRALMPASESSPLRLLKKIVFDDGATKLDDYDVMMLVYGESRPNAFTKLKGRLVNIMLQSLSLNTFELSMSNKDLSQYYQLRNLAMSAYILVDMKAYKLSVELAEAVLIKSINYYLTDNVIYLLRLLLAHYGSREFNIYKYQKYYKLEKKYLHIYELEIKSENYYLDLQKEQLQFLAQPTNDLKLKALKYMEELVALHDVESHIFFVNKFKVQAAYYEYSNDYNSLIEISNKAIKEFIGPSWKKQGFVFNVNVRKLWALIQAGRNKDAILIGQKFLNEISPSSFSWYFIAHYTIKARLYNNDFNSAIELITLVMKSPKLVQLSENFKEIFYTTLGYIHLIVDSRIIENPKELKSLLPEFKLYKFLNAIPVFSKDKRGLNVSILLMHIGFLLLRKDYNGIIDRVDSLNTYANKHLRKDDTFRSNCMIKMVIQMTRADFNPVRTARYTEDLFKKLQDVKLAGSGENIETEIIPYEVLWQIMLKACENKAPVRRQRVIG